tara:strand:+ start:188 stop:322 length:135 start_codon:yes stop_codon:yes gene_type:complete
VTVKKVYCMKYLNLKFTINLICEELGSSSSGNKETLAYDPQKAA